MMASFALDVYIHEISLKGNVLNTRQRTGYVLTCSSVVTQLANCRCANELLRPETRVHAVLWDIQ